MVKKEHIQNMAKLQYDVREAIAKEDMFELFKEAITSKDIERLLLEVYIYASNIALKNKFEYEKKNNLEVQCMQGCNHCCKYPIQVLPFETIIIKNYLRKIESDKKAAIKANLRLVKDKIKTSIKAKKHTERYRIEYLTNNIYCPFLDINSKACEIYEVRPLSCMNYFEYKSSENCVENTFSPTAVNFEDLKFTVTFSLFYAIDAYAEHNNIDKNLLKTRYIGISDTRQIANLAYMGKLEMLPNSFNNADFQ